MIENNIDDHRRLEPSEEIDGPQPPRPTAAVSTEWPDGQDLVAVHVAWWTWFPRDGDRGDSYFSLSASLDGLHVPSFVPSPSTDTQIIGIPAAVRSHPGRPAAAALTLSHAASQGPMRSLVQALEDSGCLKHGAPVSKDAPEESWREHATAERPGWQAVLFFGRAHEESTPRESVGWPKPLHAIKFTGPLKSSNRDHTHMLKLASVVHAELWRHGARARMSPSDTTAHVKNMVEKLRDAGSQGDWEHCAAILAALDEAIPTRRTEIPSGDVAALLTFAETAIRHRRDLTELAVTIFGRGWPTAQSGIKAKRWLRSIEEQEDPAAPNQDPTPNKEVPMEENDLVPIDPGPSGSGPGFKTIESSAQNAQSSASPADRTGGTSDDTKTCPDCAETIKAAANVCRYCRFRFDEAGRATEIQGE